MKVLHIAGESGASGAGRGVLWLHQGLINTAIDSKVLFQFGDSCDAGVQALHPGLAGRAKQSLISRTNALPLKRYAAKNPLFTNGWLGNDVTRLQVYKDADIIHLHWINRSMLSTGFIGKIKKPVVWTLRDMWPLTGGCHYSLDCQRYKSTCHTCPQLQSTLNPDLSTRNQNAKCNSWNKQDIHLIAISEWIKQCTDESTIFKDHQAAKVIPNCVDTEHYAPVNRQSARRWLGASDTDKVVLCGAQNLNSVYKGFDKFLEAAAKLGSSVLFAFFGRLDEDAVKRLGIRYKNLGFLSSSEELSKAYTAADVFVAPSLQEAFGKTLIESMACETPVVCFDATGPRDIIDHKVHGYKAVAADATDLAAGIEWVTNLPAPQIAAMRVACRQHVIERFSTSVVAEQYASMYTSIMQGTTLPSPSKAEQH